TTGAVLIPDDRQGVFDLMLSGAVSSRTVGSRGTIRIHMTGATTVDLSRRIVLDQNGIRVFAGQCDAFTTTDLQSIHSVMDMDNLARCTVERGYWRSKRAAEAETSHKTLRRVAERFDVELTPNLVSASQRIGAELTILKELGFSLDSLRFKTTTTSMQISA